MKVLVACEYSGRVREAFRARGHDAWSADLLPADDSSVYHFQGDVLPLLDKGWDLLIAHPPCTYLTNSGVRWLHDPVKGPQRWRDLDAAARFFLAMLNAPVKRIAVENPIMHRYAIERVGRKQDQVIQPWQFGHPERKGTGLWLKGLPLLQPTNDVKQEMLLLPKAEQNRIWSLPPTADRWKLRSTTYSGIAAAMAEQWG